MLGLIASAHLEPVGVTFFDGTFEVNEQFHQAWFQMTVARSTADFNSGAASLRCESTGAFGSGVTLSNWPYFPIVAGRTYDFSYYFKYTAGATGNVNWNINWMLEDTSDVSSNQVAATPTTTWSKVGPFSFVAPATAARLGWNFTFSVAAAGPVLWIDDLLIIDRG